MKTIATTLSRLSFISEGLSESNNEGSIDGSKEGSADGLSEGDLVGL